LSLEDAIDLFTKSESLEGFTDTKSKVEIRASKQTLIESLPKFLIFHLKRFSFEEEGAHKISKFISFPIDLFLDPKSFTRTKIEKEFKLHAVVTHIGNKVNDGHYIIDLFKNNNWYSCDDHLISNVNNIQNVLHRNAYILIYKKL
jgi:ubiquitin C-terminal hydrolase